MTRHAMDPAWLSAYRDGALATAERRAVEEHVGSCLACRERLADYASLGNALRASMAVSVPPALDFRVAAMLREARDRAAPPAPRPWVLRPAWLPRPALAALALAALLAVGAMVGLPFGNEGAGPLVASAFLYDDQGAPAIEVKFTGTVDHERVARSVQIEPAVELTVAWRGDSTLVVKPARQLPPADNYVLSLKPRGADSAATPVAFQFAGRAPTTPVALATVSPPTPAPKATSSGAVAAAPTATPTPSATAAATASPTASPTPSPSATATTTATVATPAAARCQVQPVGGFGALFLGRPEVASQLGCPRETERGVEMAVQAYQRGRLLWRADRREVVALLEDGQWRSFPDGSDAVDAGASPPGQSARGIGRVLAEHPELRSNLGIPTAPELPITGAVQEFERGLLLWTADRTIFLLRANGSWTRYADTSQEPMATPSPRVAAPPTATAVASTAPTSTATATPAPPTATATAGPTSAAVRATATATAVPTARTPGGGSSPATASPTASPTAGPSMGTSTPTATPVQETEELPAVATPTASPTQEAEAAEEPPAAATPSATPTSEAAELPATETPTPAATLQVPVGTSGAFAAVLRENPAVAARLGDVRSDELSVRVARQGFEGGLMLRRADTREIYALRRDGTWSLHRDTWREGEALPGAGQVPPGRMAPVGALGKAWRQDSSLRQALGWATGPEQSLPGTTQAFTGGRMLATDFRLVYVLYPDGTWQSFADTSGG